MEIKTLTEEQAKNLAEQGGALKAVEYKEDAPSKLYLDRFKDSLKEIEDQETLDLLK